MGEFEMIITDGFTNTYLCRLLRRVICQDIPLEPARLTQEEFEALLKLARKHEVQPMAAYGLLLAGGLTEEQEQRCRKLTGNYAAHYERMDLELQYTCELLDAAGLAYMPLKGAVIRSFYPEPWLRTSGDIDILVKDAEGSAKCLVKQGYRYKMKGSHDITMLSPLGVPVELHFQMTDTDSKVSSLLEQVWDHAKVREGTCQHEMAPELFYFYHIAHMAKHMIQGGCGIRFFVDLWILNHTISQDEETKNQLLRKGGLFTFERQAAHLSRVWFEDDQPDPLDLELESFVLNGGVFGSRSNKIKLVRTKADTSVKFFFMRIFLPYDQMILRYPILKKHPLLLPAYWLRRWAGTILKRGKLRGVVHEVKLNRTIDEDAISTTNRLFQELELF